MERNRSIILKKIKTIIWRNIASKIFYFQKKKLNFHNYTINYADKNTCLGLIEEIFFDEIYFFKPSTQKPIIIDAGANIGLSVLYFKEKMPEASVLAFEPDPETFKILKSNVEINSLTKIKLYPYALCSQTGNAPFYSDSSRNNFVGMSLTKRLKQKGFPIKKINVPCSHLSKFIKKSVELLKMDVEGSESEILGELEKNNKLSLIKSIILEVHEKTPLENINSNKIIRILNRNNFRLNLKRNTGEPFSNEKWPCQYLIYATKEK